MYYLGIDGGGTKTKYTIVDNKLKKALEVEGGTIHIHQVGIEGIKKEITENINRIFSSLNIEEKDIAFTFIGLAGYGESLEDINKIDKVMKEIFNMPYKVENDAVNGWAAGTACRPGINIVAGTGSIAFGINSEGKMERCGGFGPGIGDDGSAYWIALKTINEYTKQRDGRAERTLLSDILEEKWKITYQYEIVDIVFNRLKFNRTELAKFSMICAEAAKRGCPASIKIFKEAAKEIFNHIKALSNKLNFKEEFIVSYTGGVFKAGNIILDPLLELIREAGFNCKLQEPELNPWEGSALLAYNLAGNKVPDNVKEMLI